MLITGANISGNVQTYTGTDGSGYSGVVNHAVAEVSDYVIYRPYIVLDWNPWNDPDSDGGSLIANSEIQLAVLYWKNQYPM
ncbi:hypothetical protein [Methanococcoides sp. AM1]|uniref:hypothetical protein n=1 Tax=Methanococcoides sp. AM1 TaxID=1201011 RepID=UPI001084838F|nr:hypothetical protein [Methanococcoides sp. AM1]